MDENSKENFECWLFIIGIFLAGCWVGGELFPIFKEDLKQPTATHILFQEGNKIIDARDVNVSIYKILDSYGWNYSDWEVIQIQINESNYEGIAIVLELDNRYILNIGKGAYFEATFNIQDGLNILYLNKIPNRCQIRSELYSINQTSTLETGIASFGFAELRNDVLDFTTEKSELIQYWFDFSTNESVFPGIKISKDSNYEYAAINFSDAETTIIDGDIYIRFSETYNQYDLEYELNRIDLGNAEYSLGWIRGSQFEFLMPIYGGL